LVNVTVAEGLALERDSNIELLVELKQYNPLERQFRPIPFNEVQGFLKRHIPFTAERFPLVTLADARSLNATVAPGGALDVAVDARNDGFETVRLAIECEAGLVDRHEPQEHLRTGNEVRRFAATYPCERVSGAETLAPGEKTTLTYRLVPTGAGTVSVTFRGTAEAAGATRALPETKLAALAGVPTLLYSEGFDDPRVIRANWTADSSVRSDGSVAPIWSFARGHDRPGSLLLGVNESLVTQTSGYEQACSNVCRAYTRPFDLHNFSAEDVQLSFWHMRRLAKHDGAQVTWQVLLDERRPTLASSWSEVQCILVPRGGYDRAPPAISLVPDRENDPAEDSIPYPPWRGRDAMSPATAEDEPLFFTSDGFDDAWSYVAFDLRSQPACQANPQKDTNFTLLGSTVRFVFSVYAGSMVDSGALRRGPGHGWLIDDFALSLSRLTLRPEASQRALLLDNTTKGFHLVLGNLASQPDLVRFEVDEGNSSAPAGSILVPSEPVVIAARTPAQLVRVDVQLPRDPSFLPTQFRARVIARSVLDPTTHAKADFVLDFQPRPWAELGVSVAPPSQAVQEGTETFLPITVENTGVVASTPAVVRVTDAWPGGTQVVDIDLPSMPSYFQDAEEALRVLEFRWRPQKGSIGMHTLTFEVDPQRVGEEYTRVNNVLTLQVPVAELLLPDVDVAGPDALRLRNAVGQALPPLREGAVTRYESAAGELVTLEVKVRNPGRAAATNVDVRAFIGPLSLPAKTVPYVGPGEEVALTFNWVAQKGEYPIEVVARSELVETDASNNRNPAAGVTILVVKGFEVKVDLPAVEGVLEPGTEVKVPFNVTNVGNAGEDVLLVPRVPAGWNASVAREALYLRAGETFGTTLTVTIPARAVAGQHFISVDAIARGNPMKAATASAPTVVRAFHAGSLEAGVARGAPPLLTLPLTLVNEGNSPEPWTVMVDLPPGWTAVDALPARPVVPPHGKLELDLR
ncbi:MAG TPA: CARDB domain-containing protein, partial [Candidatus Thermoplasmatota archaeon]|nr:CARDB domain-containing protein [Candidatus Thermoplasmatota archaeon]